MLQLHQNCYSSDLKVKPANWNTRKADVKDNWHLYYRFYDPQHKDKYPKGKLVLIKGMNRYKDLAQRQEATRILLSQELQLLKEQGFNPITKLFHHPTKEILSPETYFIEALQLVLAKISCTPHTREDIKSVIKYVEVAAVQLRFDYVPIKDIKRKHIKMVLERLKEIKDRWTANTYNAYRKYLNILFKELLEFDVVDSNPIRDLSCQKITRQIRPTLSLKETIMVDAFVKRYDKHFRRMLHIFYHSGMRTTEIFRIKGEHVDLTNQTVRCFVLKGKQYEWTTRIIPNAALPFWKGVMLGCKPTDYVFSVGLQPGEKMIRPEQIRRRWKRHIKDKLKITADWYSLKHLHTDTVASNLSLKEASLHNGHKNTATTMIYAVNEKGRLENRVKDLNIKFG